jgi:hypothetical protein
MVVEGMGGPFPLLVSAFTWPTGWQRENMSKKDPFRVPCG